VNRALRAAALSALLLSPVALTACSAGQVAQTAEQNRDKTGAQGDVGGLTLRAVQLPYPVGGVYEAGNNARLMAAVSSTSDTEDTLLSIEGEDFDGVEVLDPGATTTPQRGSLDLAVPADSTLYLGDGTGPEVTLVGLSDEIGVGQFVDVTFTFEQAGEVTVPVPVATPTRDLARGEAFDFHEGEDDESVEGGGS